MPPRIEVELPGRVVFDKSEKGMGVRTRES